MTIKIKTKILLIHLINYHQQSKIVLCKSHFSIHFDLLYNSGVQLMEFFASHICLCNYLWSKLIYHSAFIYSPFHLTNLVSISVDLNFARVFCTFNSIKVSISSTFYLQIFVKILFRQLFSMDVRRYVPGKKAAETMYVRNILTFNVDETDTRSRLFYPPANVAKERSEIA